MVMTVATNVSLTSMFIPTTPSTLVPIGTSPPLVTPNVPVPSKFALFAERGHVDVYCPAAATASVPGPSTQQP